MLRLMEILHLEGDEGQSLDLVQKYPDVPSNKALLATAKVYAERGFAEFLDHKGNVIESGAVLDVNKNYRVRLTPAGRHLASALPSPLVGIKDYFWMGFGETLELLPKLIDSEGYICNELSDADFVHTGFALQEYTYARLITAQTREGKPRITEEGCRFSAAIAEAEKMTYRERHPFRTLLRRAIPLAKQDRSPRG